MGMLDVFIKRLQTGENLKEIHLGYAGISGDGVDKLAQALLSGEVSAVTTIYLHGNKITDTGIALLIPALKKCKALECLTLDGNSIKNAGAKLLLEALSNEECKVTNLVLDNQHYSLFNWKDRISVNLLNDIKEVFRIKQEKAKLQQQEELERLQGQAEQNKILLQAENNSKVDNIIKDVENESVIDLREQKIGDYGAEKLAQTLLLKEANTVKTIYLSGNNITNEGMKTLVPAIAKHITSLTHLSLSRNQVCGAELIELIKLLETGNISFLSLNEVKGEYNGVYTAIAEFIENTKTLTKLSLYGNNLGYMATPIIKALKNNETVQCLDLSGNKIYTSRLLTQFKVLLNDNHTLTKLNITASKHRDRNDEFCEINKLLDRNIQEAESKKMQHSEEIEQEQELARSEEANAMQDENQNNLLEVTPPLGENYCYPSDVVGN